MTEFSTINENLIFFEIHFMRVGLASLAVVARGSWLSPAELEAREDLCAELAEWREQHSEEIIQKSQDERIVVGVAETNEDCRGSN